MDVYATYTAYPQSGIEQIKASSGTPAAVSECSLGKLWDALHFVLTGKGSDDADAANPLSKAIIGNILRQDEEAGEHIGWLADAETAEVAKALNQADFAALLDGKAAADFQNNQIYPDIWGDEKAFVETRAELAQRFKELAAFYQAAAEQHCGVVVRIS